MQYGRVIRKAGKRLTPELGRRPLTSRFTFPEGSKPDVGNFQGNTSSKVDWRCSSPLSSEYCT